MKLENQVCSLEQGKELKLLGVVAEPLYVHIQNSIIGYEGIKRVVSRYKIDGAIKDRGAITFYPAYTVSELLKMLPFIINYDGNDYFMSFGHGSKGYRIIYETNKLGLIFNLEDELDIEKKALFSTMRSGKVAAHVLAEYLRMLLDSNSGVLFPDDCNKRLENS